MRIRRLAPAGAPIQLRDVVRSAALTLVRSDSADDLTDAVRHRFSVRYAFPYSTGRAALTVLLKGLRRLAPGRTTVVIPSYTCYSVAAAAVKAGLRPQLVDISPQTLDFCPDQLARADFRNVLAVIATNLYGVPNNLPFLQHVARTHGVFLIDDAAQAMGAEVAGRPCGTWGDAGIFSFDKGKGISAISGGVVVTDSDVVAGALKDENAGLDKAPSFGTLDAVLKLLAYSLFLPPAMYWIPSSLPQLGLGSTVFSTDFALARPIPLLATVAATMLDRLPTFTEMRRRNAEAILSSVRNCRQIEPITPGERARPSYLRLPILTKHEEHRRQTIAALDARGLGVSASYPASIADVPELRGLYAASPESVIGGRHVARHLLTLPTHPFVRPIDVTRICGELHRLEEPLATASAGRTAVMS